MCGKWSDFGNPRIIFRSNHYPYVYSFNIYLSVANYALLNNASRYLDKQGQTVRLCLFASVLLNFASVASSLQGMSMSYHIGNSLTFDAMALKTAGSGLEAIASQMGLSHDAAYHIDSSQSLLTMWDQPQGVNGIDEIEAPYNEYVNALGNYAWDAVTLEPYWSPTSTLGTDKKHIQDFINLTQANPSNSATKFYLYQVWPKLSWGNYESWWLSSSPNQDSTVTWQKREYYQNLMNWVDSTYQGTGTIVREIPTGEVMYELSLRIAEGSLPGITSISQFYRDDIHFNDRGKYVASMTIASVLFEHDPRGQTPPDPFFSQNLFSAEMTAAINDTIWKVITSSSSTGLADYNDDGVVDDFDMIVWQNAYATNALADADGDGDSDGSDFLVWQRQVKSLNLVPVASIPEPAKATIITWLALGIFNSRYQSNYHRTQKQVAARHSYP